MQAYNILGVGEDLSCLDDLHKDGEVKFAVFVTVLGAKTKLCFVLLVVTGLCPLVSVLFDHLDVDLNSWKVDRKYVAKYKSG